MWLRKLNTLDENDLLHIIRLHSTFVFDGHFCIVFELMGPSIREVVSLRGDHSLFSPASNHNSVNSSATGGMNIWNIRNIAVQMLASLAFLHDSDIIHADIKPDNVVTVPTGDAIVKRQRRDDLPQQTDKRYELLAGAQPLPSISLFALFFT